MDINLIYGRKKSEALKLLSQGCSKSRILEQTGTVVGISGASLTIKEGEIFVIIGRSGSGKSSLVRCINRLNDPDSGSILVNNTDITTLSIRQLLNFRRENLSMVFQHFGLFPHMNILQNVSYGLKVKGISKQARYTKALEVINTVGLESYTYKMPHQLSGGMQQRVGLARALATSPHILLMDEAFSALDPISRAEMQDELLKLQAKLNKTIVFITHDMEEAVKIGDRVAVMDEGEIVQIGTPSDILNNPATEYVSSLIGGLTSSRKNTPQQVLIDAMDSIEAESISFIGAKEIMLGSLNKGDLQGETTLEDLWKSIPIKDNHLENE